MCTNKKKVSNNLKCDIIFTHILSDDGQKENGKNIFKLKMI